MKTNFFFKKVSLCISLFTVTSLIAQQTIDADFGKYGIKKVTFESDPTRLSKWEVKISPLALTEVSNASIGVQIRPKYRLTDKFEVEGRCYLQYNGYSTDIFKKRFQDIGIEGSYTLFGKISEKVKPVSVDYVAGDVDEIVVLKVKLPVKTQRLFKGHFGLGFMQFNSGVSYRIQNEFPNFVTYKGSPVSSFGLNVGTSFQKIISHKVITNNKERSYFKIGTISASLTYGLVNKLKIYAISNTDNEPMLNDDLNLDVNAIGWRVSMDQTLGLKNSGCGLLFGCEFGSVPQYSFEHQTNGSLVTTDSFLLMLRIGLVIGKNPWG